MQVLINQSITVEVKNTYTVQWLWSHLYKKKKRKKKKKYLKYDFDMTWHIGDSNEKSKAGKDEKVAAHIRTDMQIWILV